MNVLNSRSCRMLMAAVIIGSASSQALAVEAPDEIVVTATRTPNPVSKLPVAVEVITREQIGQSGARSLADALEEAHDVNTLEPGNGRLGIAKLRGLDSRLTLLLLDGMRITSGFQGSTDLREIPAGIIDRIEIVRGAGSALYGSDAVGGVINVITRKPTKELYGGASLSGGASRSGQAGTVETGGWLTGTTGKLGYSVAASYYDRDRYDRHPADLLTNGDDRVTASGSVALTCDLSSGVKLTGGMIYADNSLDGLRTQSGANSTRYIDSDRLLVHVGAEIKTGEESNLTMRASRTTYDWKSDMAWFSGIPEPIEKPAGTFTSTFNLMSLSRVSQDADQIEARWSGKLQENHRFTAGVEYRAEERTDYSFLLSRAIQTKSSVTTTKDVRYTAGGTHDADNFGLFAQDEFRIIEPLSVIAGIRYDEHSDFGSEISPKIAALLRLDDHLKLRASCGEGFRAPSIYELYTGSLQTRQKITYPNPELEAETSRSYELGADLSLEGFSAGVTAFRNEMKDMISEVLINGAVTPKEYRYDNIDQAMTRGIEFNASLKLPYGCTVSDKVTLLDTENRRTGAALYYNPDITNVLRLDYANGRLGLKGNIRLVSIGTQYVSDTEKIPGCTLVNCYLSKAVAKSTELFAGVDNLFNDDANAGYGNNEGAGAMGTCFHGGLNFKL
jgi:outer membrane receptor for ferrienterochelin and colicins